MKRIITAAALVAFTAAASAPVYAADNKTTGLVGGVVAGAVVAGPVGAVVGGATGYTIGKEVDKDHHRHKVIRKHRDTDGR